LGELGLMLCQELERLRGTRIVSSLFIAFFLKEIQSHPYIDGLT